MVSVWAFFFLLWVVSLSNRAFFSQKTDNLCACFHCYPFVPGVLGKQMGWRGVSCMHLHKICFSALFELADGRWFVASPKLNWDIRRVFGDSRGSKSARTENEWIHYWNTPRLKARWVDDKIANDKNGLVNVVDSNHVMRSDPCEIISARWFTRKLFTTWASYSWRRSGNSAIFDRRNSWSFLTTPQIMRPSQRWTYPVPSAKT